MAMAPRIEAHLQKVGIQYDLVGHPHSATSIQSALSAHIPPKQVAKAVIVHDGDQYCMAVIPATHRLVLDWLNERMQHRFRLASEDELVALFEDCEVGALPALGQVYGMPVIWDEELKDAQDIYFESGDHEHLVHLRQGAFQELMGLQEHCVISCPDGDAADLMVH